LPDAVYSLCLGERNFEFDAPRRIPDALAREPIERQQCDPLAEAGTRHTAGFHRCVHRELFSLGPVRPCLFARLEEFLCAAGDSKMACGVDACD